MKFARFSIFLAIAGLFFLSFASSCRHDSPTGPTDTTGNSDTSSCCHGRLTLTVTDSATGHPLDGGTASLYEGSHLIAAKTMNESGTVWDGLCPGRYHMTISKDGYSASNFDIDSLGCNATRTISRTLSSSTAHSGDSCCSGRDYITAEDSSTHQVLLGATIVLLNRTTGVSQTATTSSSTNGVIRFGDLCPGNYLCTITKDGYTTLSFDWLQTCDEVLSFTKSLLGVHHSDSCCSGIVELTVTDSGTGHGISNASVILYDNGNQLHSAYSGDNGSVRFDGLCEGSYRITINHDGYTQGVVEFYEHCNTTHSFAASLLATTTTTACDTASISVHVRDSIHQDMNVSGATVTLRIDGHSDNFTNGTTNSEGYYFTDHNLPGHTTYIMTISKDGYATKSIVWQIGDCKNYGELIYLSPQ